MSPILFLGTPLAAVPTLERLASDGDVGLVVTRPDRPRGRSGRPQPSPVKEAAHRLGLEVVQPEKSKELSGLLAARRPFEVAVVVAFGMLIPPEVLTVPRLGFLNVHFSLLPRWRGASPVVAALLAGDPLTGVTIIQLDQGLDTGPIVASLPVEILPGETAGDLTNRLSVVGADLLIDVLPAYLRGDKSPTPQPVEGATYAPRLTAKDRRLDVSWAPPQFVKRVRALSPRPGAQLEIDGLIFKILEAAVEATPAKPGSIIAENGHLFLGVGGYRVEILRLQPPGRQPMSPADWLRGLKRLPGEAR